jgi:protein O-GlcNAc transferase
VNYLGYPGTMGSPDMDYIIVDPFLIPEGNRGCYSEKIAYLPHSYLPYDRQRAIGKKSPTRREQGLPERGFVFACFNNLYKITPDVFDIWMRLLHAIAGSVLWISETNGPAAANLKREAAARGIAPERLIFARYEASAADHLARQSLADLFLDTLPYNAHSTASDALWAGLPLLTCCGQAFPGRVAAGVLHAIGLPELVTTSPGEYEERALALANDPERLAALRQKLAHNRSVQPLFDIERYTRDLEAIYRTMWERQQSGLVPETFSMAAIP